MIELDPGALRALMVDILTALDVPDDECAIVVNSFMEATLAGYDSHGIMRIPMYFDDIRSGQMVPGASLDTVTETPASALLDANYGLGPVIAERSLAVACDKARQTGIGCVSVTRSNEIARLGVYVREPALAGLITVLMVNDAGGGPVVAPWGSTQPFLSTNPIAVGFPWRDDTPIIIDLSTSIVAAGKLKMARSSGSSAPEGWLIDRHGETTTDVESFFAEPRMSALLPLGGLMAGHKGFALSLIVDILGGALSGDGCSSGEEMGNRNGVFALAIDPQMFATRDVFLRHVNDFVEKLKACDTMPGVDEILMPGERSQRVREQRLKNGVPIEPSVWQEITRIMDELGLTHP
jgi:LDH2 family malate/lactate/ureidoglycolate dehydrogenase